MWSILENISCAATAKSHQSFPTLCNPIDGTHQAPQIMGFSRQQYWSGLPFPSPGDLPNPGIEPGSPALEAEALTSEPPEFWRIAGRDKKAFLGEQCKT